MEWIRTSRPSPAIVVAVSALVAALAGTAIAGPDATTSALTKSKVKKIATKQATKAINQLVPGLADEQITRRAPGLSVAMADTAANADALEGRPATAFASSTSEPYHEIGTPGEPGFQNSWVNFEPQQGVSTAAFYKDPLGVVHLKGTVSNTISNRVAFTLPEGYRPSQKLTMPAAKFFEGAAKLIVEPGGEVFPICDSDVGGCPVGMDGLTFRAG